MRCSEQKGSTATKSFIERTFIKQNELLGSKNTHVQLCCINYMSLRNQVLEKTYKTLRKKKRNYTEYRRIQVQKLSYKRHIDIDHKNIMTKLKYRFTISTIHTRKHVNCSVCSVRINVDGFTKNYIEYIHFYPLQS